MKKYSDGCLAFTYDVEKEVAYRELSFLGFPGYRVGTDGSVWSRRVGGRRFGLAETWHQLKPIKTKLGYHQVGLSKNGKCKTFWVHQLVLFCFDRYPRPEGFQCRHLDGKPWNNGRLNLCWGTAKEDAEDRRRHGTLRGRVGPNPPCQGEKHINAIFTEAQIHEIRYLHSTGAYSNEYLAECYGSTPSSISAIAHFVTWKHVKSDGRVKEVPDWRKKPRHRSKLKLTEEKVKEIRRLAKSGMNYWEIGRRYGVSDSTVREIVIRKWWAWVEDD